MRRLLYGIACAVVAATTAEASVTLEFDGITEFVQDIKNQTGPSFAGEGTYYESGFTVDVGFNIFGGGPEHKDGTLGLHDQCTGCGDLFFSATIRNSSGLPFALNGFKIESILSNYFAYYADVDKTLALYWPGLEVTGTKVSGDVYQATISPWVGVSDNATSLFDGNELPGGGGGMEAAIAKWSSETDPGLGKSINLGSQFSNLRSLEFRVLDFDPSSVCSAINLDRVGASCDVSDPWVDSGLRNDELAIRLESITLSPVPVPVPAMLLFTALVALGGLRAMRVRQVG